MSDKMAGYDELATNHLFQGLDSEEIKAVYARGTVVTLKAGEIVISEGQTHTDLYVILRGTLEVTLPKTSARFSSVRLGRLGDGQFVGEYSFIDRIAASASVKTVQQSILFKISAFDLEELLESSDHLGRVVYKNLLSSLVKRLRSKDHELDLLGPLAK